MSRAPGKITVTTETGFCSFCGRPRNLRREERRLGELLRTTVTCEHCHRTLFSTTGLASAKPEPQPEPESEPKAATVETSTTPASAAATAPATKASAPKPAAPAAKGRPAKAKAEAKSKPAAKRASKR